MAISVAAVKTTQSTPIYLATFDEPGLIHRIDSQVMIKTAALNMIPLTASDIGELIKGASTQVRIRPLMIAIPRMAHHTAVARNPTAL
ncbi:Uncharacterised protein [BD1-7 clade bacterium]|uniref:Uncharacterized protein n=1 Tax=BD1-7 clade bacterium TaxID=2029982 RepID=A0A5S9QN45_9GAMM|nr:Uncharacterised protein [BD1-7 clade bacterium]